MGRAATGGGLTIVGESFGPVTGGRFPPPGGSGRSFAAGSDWPAGLLVGAVVAGDSGAVGGADFVLAEFGAPKFGLFPPIGGSGLPFVPGKA